jgi:hypothetical protein
MDDETLKEIFTEPITWILIVIMGGPVIIWHIMAERKAEKMKKMQKQKVGSRKSYSKYWKDQGKHE